jgi:hypothetical protein
LNQSALLGALPFRIKDSLACARGRPNSKQHRRLSTHGCGYSGSPAIFLALIIDAIPEKILQYFFT